MSFGVLGGQCEEGTWLPQQPRASSRTKNHFNMHMTWKLARAGAGSQSSCPVPSTGSLGTEGMHIIKGQEGAGTGVRISKP